MYHKRQVISRQAELLSVSQEAFYLELVGRLFVCLFVCLFVDCMMLLIIFIVLLIRPPFLISKVTG
jgi:hypothetical protein